MIDQYTVTETSLSSFLRLWISFTSTSPSILAYGISWNHFPKIKRCYPWYSVPHPHFDLHSDSKLALDRMEQKISLSLLIFQLFLPHYQSYNPEFRNEVRGKLCSSDSRRLVEQNWRIPLFKIEFFIWCMKRGTTEYSYV